MNYRKICFENQISSTAWGARYKFDLEHMELSTCIRCGSLFKNQGPALQLAALRAKTKNASVLFEIIKIT